MRYTRSQIRKGREFAPNPMHRYTLAPGVMVQSAKFGAVQVDIWQDEPSPIYRGEPKTEVGRASIGLWRYVVHGSMSGSATTEAAARAKGERVAWEKCSGSRIFDARFTYAYDEAAEQTAFAVYLADIRARFPA